MTLKDRIAERIRHSGPISIADYMGECLLHPTLGYYTTRDPLGAAGDFITAPEISQMFGELIGLCLAQTWLDQGSPSRFTLAELGPGRGTLMADALRATRSVAGFHQAAKITLIEASPTLRAAQATILGRAAHAAKLGRAAPAAAARGAAPVWLDHAHEIPDQPLFLIANEFFDALPIRQFIRSGDSWRERLIGVQDNTLTFGLGATAPQPALAHHLPDTKDGDLVEHCPQAAPIINELSQRITSHGGAALIIDYGDWRSRGDTFQALIAHQPTDVLNDPGQADLTAHVDFEALALATTRNCAHTRLTPQGVFLERLGITARAQKLAQGLSGKKLDDLVCAHRRLTSGQEMGTLFKVLGLYPAHASPPPGLDP